MHRTGYFRLANLRSNRRAIRSYVGRIAFMVGAWFAVNNFFVPGYSFAETVVVEIKATKLRSAPQFWAKAVADLGYGDKLEVISEAAAWVKVKKEGGVEGFVQTTALTKKSVILTSEKTVPADIAFDPARVTLAGKGFSKRIEDDFKKSGGKIDYSQVDRLESAVAPDPLKLHAFIIEGKLTEVS